MQAVPPAGYQPGYQAGAASVPPNYDPAGYQAGYAQPGYPQQDYPQPGYGPPEYGNYQQQWPAQDAAPKRSRTVLVLVILLIVVVLGGVGVGVYLYQHKGTAATAPTPPAAGTCVNEQTGPPITMVSADCASATFQVVKVFTGTDNRAACDGVAGVTNFYTFTWPPESSGDYVLCLKSPGQ